MTRPTRRVIAQLLAAVGSAAALALASAPAAAAVALGSVPVCTGNEIPANSACRTGGPQGTPLSPVLAGGIGEGKVITAGGPADVVPPQTPTRTPSSPSAFRHDGVYPNDRILSLSYLQGAGLNAEQSLCTEL